MKFVLFLVFALCAFVQSTPTASPDCSFGSDQGSCTAISQNCTWCQSDGVYCCYSSTSFCVCNPRDDKRSSQNVDAFDGTFKSAMVGGTFEGGFDHQARQFSGSFTVTLNLVGSTLIQGDFNGVMIDDSTFRGSWASSDQSGELHGKVKADGSGKVTLPLVGGITSDIQFSILNF